MNNQTQAQTHRVDAADGSYYWLGEGLHGILLAFPPNLDNKYIVHRSHEGMKLPWNGGNDISHLTKLEMLSIISEKPSLPELSAKYVFVPLTYEMQKQELDLPSQNDPIITGAKFQ